MMQMTEKCRDSLGCLPSIGKPASIRLVQGIRPGSTSTVIDDDDEFSGKLALDRDSKAAMLTEGHEVEQHAHRIHSYIPSSFCRSSTLW